MRSYIESEREREREREREIRGKRERGKGRAGTSNRRKSRINERKDEWKGNMHHRHK
jgi:hypothetical protein